MIWAACRGADERIGGYAGQAARADDRTESDRASYPKQLATDLHDYLAQLLVLSRIKLGQAKLEEVTPAAMDP